jgi:hypothetical protein
MIQKLLGAILVLSSATFTGAVSAQEQPNLDWEGNWGFGRSSAGQRDQAYMIEFQKKGGFRTNITNNTTVTNNSTTICEAGGGCVSNIENQINTTAIGVQLNTEINVTDSENVEIDLDMDGETSGPTGADTTQISTDTVNVEIPGMFEGDL